jgi:hypothetical protein
MKRSTVLLVLILAILFIAAGLAPRDPEGMIARWIAALHGNRGH